MLLKDKVAVITGAASPRGIGKQIAKVFASQGAKVVILDLNAADAEAAANDIGSEHLGLACNVTKKEDCVNAAKAAFEKYGKIDILVNNAGITQPIKFLDIKPENYEAVTDVSLRGMLYASQAVVPYMQENNGGSIINMASVSAQRGGGIFGGPHYSAAKAGMLGLGKAMARELGINNIRINAINPGLIQTDITAGKLTDEMKAEILKGIPLNRLGVTDDIANACLFLGSDLSQYMTGCSIDVNGGMHMY